jgi:type IV pilus assembly protein PilC
MIAIGQGDPKVVQETFSVVGFLLFFVFWIVATVVWNFIILFWPFLLYFWANVVVVRQRTLLSLIQTALETGTPLPNMIRAYAAGCCWWWYAARLERFAAALDTGSSLEEAVRNNRGLFRYDVAGMIRLGSDKPETLRAVEDIAQDERDFAMFRTSQTVRVVYLCMLAVYMMMIMMFMFTSVVPQFEKIFKDFDTSFPQLTLFVIAASWWLVKYWYVFVPFVWLGGLFFLTYLILQTNIAIFRPFGFRRIFRNTDAAKFLMIFATGIRHRFPIPSILEMYCLTVPSAYLRRKGAKIQTTIEKGRDWIDAVRRAGFVSGPEASLLQTAERTGNTAAVLDQLARSKERSQIREDDLVSKMVFIPLVFVLGAVVGVFAVGMFLPIVKLITSLS